MTPQTTTIRVSRRTLEELDWLRKTLGANSYEEAILKLLEEHKKRLLDAYFGVDKDLLSPFTEEDRGEDRFSEDSG